MIVKDGKTKKSRMFLHAAFLDLQTLETEA